MSLSILKVLKCVIQQLNVCTQKPEFLDSETVMSIIENLNFFKIIQQWSDALLWMTDLKCNFYVFDVKTAYYSFSQLTLWLVIT